MAIIKFINKCRKNINYNSFEILKKIPFTSYRKQMGAFIKLDDLNTRLLIKGLFIKIIILIVD